MSPKPHHVAGAILEEAILALLKSAGFNTVEELFNDPTIDPRKPAVTIRGRGTAHQIDAVADPVIGYAFSNPARLLIEAKAYSGTRVGLDIVRNAVGTLKDISEFWNSGTDGRLGIKRYHYRFAIFSTTEFTEGAQKYAFAQDIYLLPLSRSAFFRPVVNAIRDLRDFFTENPDVWQERGSLTAYRNHVRNALRNNAINDDYQELNSLLESIQQVQLGLIAIAMKQFPIFLVPNNPDIINQLNEFERVRIFWDNEGWYLRRPGEDENLFSFDLPEELFTLYATGDNLDPEQALHLKAEQFSELQAFLIQEDRKVRLIRFELDDNWIRRLLERLE